MKLRILVTFKIRLLFLGVQAKICKLLNKLYID